MLPYTVHGVLAGAYAARNPLAMLTHASVNDGATALCNRVRIANLCDLQEEGPPSCPHCLRVIYRGSDRQP